MPKNKYPDSLGLDDCKDMSDVIDKLKMFYEMEYAYFDDLIREILRHKYGLNKSDDENDDDYQLLKHLLIDLVPGTPKDIIFNINEYDRDVEFRKKITNRRASIIAMFKIYESKGKSQNQIANILANKGMSKGLKVRYHEALRNEEAVDLSCLLDHEQTCINFQKHLDSRKDIRKLKGDEIKKELAKRIEPNVDFLIEHYNNNK